MIMETENWRSIAGYEGLYAVSDLGRVKSLERTVQRGSGEGAKILRERLLKAVPTRGHFYVTLCSSGGQKIKEVSKLVAEAFCKSTEAAL